MPPIYTNEKICDIYSRNIDTVYRICFIFMKSHTQDLEDAIQTTFLNMLSSGKTFESKDHEKAWLIVTASNVCKNMLAQGWRRKVKLQEMLSPDQTIIEPQFEIDETLNNVMALPDRYKTAVYLHYYNGYTGVEIAKLLGKSESTVWGYLHKGRKLLKSLCQEEEE